MNINCIEIFNKTIFLKIVKFVVVNFETLKNNSIIFKNVQTSIEVIFQDKTLQKL